MDKKVYYEEGVIPLVFRMALSHREEKGTPEEIFERHKSLIYDLLKGMRQDPEVQGWNDETAKKICTDLTEHQKVFLKTLVDAEKPLSIPEIGKAFDKAGLRWTSDRKINGILAGFSRRSKRYRVPSIWGWKVGEDTAAQYFIDEEAARLVKKYL